MDGIYVCMINTPIGKMEGKVTLKQTDNLLSGKIEAMGMNSSFSNGTINGNKFECSGVIHLIIGNLSYNAKGTYEGDTINITANTNKGVFEFAGKKQ